MGVYKRAKTFCTFKACALQIRWAKDADHLIL